MNSKTTGWCSVWRDHGSFMALVFSLVCCVAAQAQRTATATAMVVNGFVVAITVTDGGAGYGDAPVVTIGDGRGSGAEASASVADGVVTQVTVSSPGSGYTSTPSVVISDPPPPEAPVIEGVRLQSAVTIRGAVGTTHWIMYADALTPWAWTVLTNLVVSTSPYVFVDREASPLRRFYHVAAGASPPTIPLFTPDLTRYAYIPPGIFKMGSPASEQDRVDNEGPQTVVTLTKGFWMGKYEVTQAEYLAVMEGNPSSFTGNLNRPVEHVTWYEATNYCAALTAQERSAGRLPAGWAYRLPTEAEWEYAARAGTTTRFSYGDDPGYAQLANYAWYWDNSGFQTHPVGQKQPNPWGLNDMYGNVWEWCWDRFGTYPGGSVTDPTGSGSGSDRVLRGGGWGNVGQYCRSADRSRSTPDYRSNGIGFRAVLTADLNPPVPPSVSAHPQSQIVGAGTIVVFTVAATGTPPLAYQWRKGGVNLADGGRISGATTTHLIIRFVEGADAGNYDVVVSNAVGAAASDGAVLAVPDMIWIPPGTFTMGSPASEQDRFDDEGPRTVVTLTKGFWMGRHEVTQAEYAAVMKGYPSLFTGDPTLPVEQVSWYEATIYCAGLTARERGGLPAGWAYRLPTEAEWEYAARAGTTTRFSYGDDPGYAQLGDFAWHEGNSGDTTHPVGLREANPWCLDDMYGNVFEWCLDWYGTYPGGSVTDPMGPASGLDRVMRGGSWDLGRRFCRSADRANWTPDDRSSYIGFRAVLAAAPAIPTFTPDLNRYAYIPPGTFTMGSPASEQDRVDNEGPQTVVTLTKGFWMERYEVTQAEYLAVMGGNPSLVTGNLNRPVEMVSWIDATNYCATLTARERSAGRLPTGWAYRLPTEAEWEYAARAGTTTRFSYGDDPDYSLLRNYAWYYDNSGDGTHPVGQKQANPWGLNDMYGNVFEWCLDWYGTYPGGSLTDPIGPASGSVRVARGGGWRNGGGGFRSADRANFTPDDRSSYIGFRAVLAADLNPPVPPSVSAHPQSQTVGAGTNVVFTVAATGTPPLAYQWRKGGVNLADGGRISGATTTNLTIRLVQGADAGNYDVVVSNAVGSATSEGAVLAVPNAPVDVPDMIWIPPGTFTMGSPASEQDRLGDEGPQTVVTLTKGFWMGRYEVTQAEYRAVMGSNPSSFTGDPTRPVEQVSWIDATNYCATLTAQGRAAGWLPTGWAYRLPTEAEWEYAARAGTTTRFSYGDDPGYTQLSNYAWYSANSGNTSHPVGQKQANPWGLNDMYGNVWEWCLDWYGNSLPGGSVTDPMGPASGSDRVLRGGGWLGDGLYCRSARRLDNTPDGRYFIIGFRAVLAAGQP